MTTAHALGSTGAAESRDEHPADVVGPVHASTLLATVLRHRALVGGCALTGLVIGLGLALLLPYRYTATASFVPQSRRSTPSVAGLAAQFGVNIPSESPSESPQFYADLLESREILGPVVDSSYSLKNDGKVVSESLVRFYADERDSPAKQRERAIERLRSAMTVNVSPRTSVVSVAVQTRSAPLSASIVARILAEVNFFNLEKRQSQASIERHFTENRLNEANVELHAAENRLEQFQQTNRAFGSPRLELEKDRLARDIAMRQQVYTTLAQLYEQARIEEVRDNPVISVIEAPELPAEHDPTHALSRGVLGLIGGTILGCIIVIIITYRKMRIVAEYNRPELNATEEPYTGAM